MMPLCVWGICNVGYFPPSCPCFTLTIYFFFQHKQLELEDKMDLASYLLKPIQRMSKYALLLKDLIKEVSEAQEQELSYLCAAAEMVKFQLRHGNDLLAMDAIRDCDVSQIYTSDAHTPESLLPQYLFCLYTIHIFVMKT